MDQAGDLSGRVAIVTGGANGLGAAQSRMLASNGANVIVADIDVERAHEVVTQIRECGGIATAVRLDVSQPDEWEEVMASCCREFGRLDVLVNNAGIMIAKDVETVTLEEWHSLHRVNTDGAFLGMKYAIGQMKQAEGGSIINISSIMGLVGEPVAFAYVASKGAVTTMTKSAALYCANRGYGIRVNAVHPGVIMTPLIEELIKLGGENGKIIQDIIQKHPIGRIGVAEEIAEGVLFLASDRSRFMTGSSLVIDGGYTAQ